MTPAIAALSVPKICGEGVIATTMQALDITEEDSYIGIAFKYIKKSDYFSFEIGADKC